MTTRTDRQLLEDARARLDDLADLQQAGLVNRDGFFYPSVHYPPITMYDPIDDDGLFDGFEVPHDARMSVYVHIPFCDTRCVFCHYPVTVGLGGDHKDHYLAMLAREMELWVQRLGVDRVRATSALIAGGTPTAMSVPQFRRFHDDFVRHVDLTDCSQLAYDVHPRTLLGAEGAERLRIMRDHGSERLTIGVQTFDDALLTQMNRGHTAEEALASIEACRAAGYDDICIEFIYGYPGQTMDSWLRDMRMAIDSGVDEIQIYRLKIEAYGDEAGPIQRMYETRPEKFVSPHDAVLMKQAAILMLGDHGYRETLTRVFSRDPQKFSHYASDQCCELRDQIGWGMSAFSSLHDRFSINPDTLDEYYARLEQGRVPVNRGLVRSADENKRWNVILPLKNWKVVQEAFRANTGESFADAFPEQIALLQRHDLIDINERRARLTPRGRFFADEICQQFHTRQYIPHPRERYADGPLNPYRFCSDGE